MNKNYTFADRSMQTEVCIIFPEKLSSDGHSPTNIHRHILPMVELQIILIFLIQLLCHNFLRRFGFTKMTSELIAGMLITPRVLGEISVGIFTPPSEQIVSIANKYNYILFLFLIGVRTDVNVIRTTGRSAIISGFLGLFIPLFIGLGLVRKLTDKYDLDDKMALALINITFVYAATPFAGVLRFVSELQLVNSELGWQAMSVGTAGDMFSIWTFFTLYSINVMSFTHMWIPSIVSLGGVLVYVAVLIIIVRPAILWVVRNTPEGSMVSDKYVFAILAAAGLSSMFFYSIGQSVVIAPYLLGLAVPAGPPFGTTLEAKLNTMVSCLFMPLFVSTIAMKIDLAEIKVDNPLMLCVAIILAATAGAKFITYLVSAWCFKLPKTDSFALAFILSYRGVIEIACFDLSYELGLINDEIFSMACFAVFMTLWVLPLIVRLLYDPSRKYAGYKVRNIMTFPAKAELPILACIYRSEDIPAITSVVDSAAAGKDRALSVHALHITKLSGQLHPMFITHGLEKNAISNYKRSKEVIFSFKKLARDNPGVSSLHAYTSMTLQTQMHEDICMLALSNLTCIIIVPFHRTWTLDGFIQHDDQVLRTLNCSIMQRAPCSVGVLVDKGSLVRRGYHRQASLPTTFNVTMLFFGGKDDREGLAFAKRMAHNPYVQLTVVCFTCDQGDSDKMSWERILDIEQLNDVKNGDLEGGGRITYMEEFVQDGLQTLDKIRDIVKMQNLVIVGRRYKQTTKQTAGLEGWSDFPELGVIGDLLISSDFSSDHSVLVVQQQIQAGSNKNN